jgi:hypothetical protein
VTDKIIRLMQSSTFYINLDRAPCLYIFPYIPKYHDSSYVDDLKIKFVYFKQLTSYLCSENDVILFLARKTFKYQHTKLLLLLSLITKLENIVGT